MLSSDGRIGVNCTGVTGLVYVIFMDGGVIWEKG